MKKQIICFSSFTQLNQFIDQVEVFEFEVNRRNYNLIGHFSENDLQLARCTFEAQITELPEYRESCIYLN